MRRARFAAPLALVCLAALMGCPTQPPVTKPPTPSPSASFYVPASPSAGAYADLGIEVLGGTLAIDVVDGSGAPVKGATLKLYGNSLASASADANGQCKFAPVAEGQGYRLIVEAPGYASLQVGNIQVQKKLVTTERASLSRGADLTGRVTAGGQPVAGAVVSDGLNSTLTDAQGAYTLRGAAAASVTLTASKPRYAVASQVVSAGTGATNLTLTPAEPVVYLDGESGPGPSLGTFQQLRSGLAKAGWKLQDTPPTGAGVWILISPASALSSDKIERITTFVAQGGKLVLFGEWGGYAGFNTVSANQLAHAVGLHINPDVVRDSTSERNPEWLTIRSFQANHPATAGLSALSLYQSASVFGLAPMATLAQTDAGAYRVQSNAPAGPHAVVAGGPFKGGKAIVLGDASMVADADTDGDGQANWAEADNAKLVLQLLDW